MRRDNELNFNQHEPDRIQRPSFFWRLIGFLFKIILLLLLVSVILLLLALFYLLASQIFGFENVLFK
ncbi:MAG: hypothetical protein IJL45_07765 [Prevotella sp.]|jgi:hypothetical protein|nr:hypothetical protein [Prevotella sp.]MBQ6187923.1 hypothetical protein [Prevotella sp.]